MRSFAAGLLRSELRSEARCRSEWRPEPDFGPHRRLGLQSALFSDRGRLGPGSADRPNSGVWPDIRGVKIADISNSACDGVRGRALRRKKCTFDSHFRQFGSKNATQGKMGRRPGSSSGPPAVTAAAVAAATGRRWPRRQRSCRATAIAAPSAKSQELRVWLEPRPLVSCQRGRTRASHAALRRRLLGAS